MHRLVHVVRIGTGMGYMAASLADVPDTCTFASAGMNDWLQQLVIAGIVVLGSTAAGPIITYITQIAKIALRLFGLDHPRGREYTTSGGKVALVIGVVFVQVVIGANVLGIRDALTEHFELAARVLGSAVAILVALLTYPKLKAARLMPGARVVEIEAVALTTESPPASVPYQELVERVKVLEQKYLEDHGGLEI